MTVVQMTQPGYDSGSNDTDWVWQWFKWHWLGMTVVQMTLTGYDSGSNDTDRIVKPTMYVSVENMWHFLVSTV